MRITHYLYNAFILDDGQTRIAIDPGQHLGLLHLKTLIPESQWPGITHVVVTHGDPDHHWHTDRIAEASGAHIVCGTGLGRTVDGGFQLVHPRGRGLSAWIALDRVTTLAVGETAELEGVRFEAIRAIHGPIAVPVLGYTIRQQPGPGERVGLGAMGFLIDVGGTAVLNLGDTLLLPEWEGLRPDVLMLPIGGLGNNTWTMDVTDAVEAVRLIAPGLVIPCHYNVPFFWIRNAAPANPELFKAEVERMGVRCCLLRQGDTVEV